MSKELAEKFSAAIEVVSRREAARIEFDMENEPHALFRMMMVVLSSKELRSEAIDLFISNNVDERIGGGS